MKLYKPLLSILLFSMSIFMLSACDSGGSSSSAPTNTTSTSGPSYSQAEIEALATDSLEQSAVSESFSFTTQRIVEVELFFLQPQTMTQLEIFLEPNYGGQSPSHLIEKGQLNNAQTYQSKLTIPSAYQSIIVVVNQDYSSPTELLIFPNNRLYHQFD